MCTQPKTIWLAYSRPINFNKLTEQQQKNINKAHFKSYPNCYCIEIPCGECEECRLAHANEWATRCTMEAKNWNSNYFVTLTYRPDALPTTKEGIPTLRPKDLTNFFKRLRKHKKGNEKWKNINTGKTESPIRYFACGEYGEKKGRPHYHAALFNLKLDDLKPLGPSAKTGHMLYKSKTLQEIWGLGFVVIGELTYKSASYISRYVMKKAGLPKKIYYHKDEYDNKKKKWVRRRRIMSRDKNRPEPEFIRMSRGVGLGRTFWEEKKHLLYNGAINLTIYCDDKLKIINIPRYFRKLFEKEDWQAYENWRFKMLQQVERSIEQQLKQTNIDNASDFTKTQFIRSQREKRVHEIYRRLRRNNMLTFDEEFDDLQKKLPTG